RSDTDLFSFKAPTKVRFDVMVFSPDRRYVATDSPDNKIVLRELSTGHALKTFGEGRDQSIKTVAFAPDLSYLASGDAAGELSLWNIQTGQRDWALHVGPVVNDIAFSPNGRLLAFTTSTDALTVLDTRTRKIAWRTQTLESRLNRVLFSRDGKTLA